MNGRVTDRATGLPVRGAEVADVDGPARAVSDSAGRFVLREVPPGMRTIRISQIGYREQERTVDVVADRSAFLEVFLDPEAIGLEGITAVGESRAAAELREVRQSPFAVSVVDGQRLASRGLTLDEVVQRAAGVQVRRSGGLGSASVFNIRGLEGRRVQVFIDGNSVNLLGDDFSLDDIPVVLVERVEIYKGIVPARFGGDGLGAAVNVVLRDFESGYDDVHYTAGAHGQHQLGTVFLRQLGPRWTLGSAVSLDRAENDYTMESPFIPGLEIRRDHDRFRRTLAGGVIEYKGAWFDKLRLEGALIRSSREIQGIQTNVQHAESGSDVGALVLEADREDALDGRLDTHFALVATASKATLVDTSSVRYTFEGNPYPSPNGRGELGLLPAHSDNRTRSLRQRGTLTFRFSPTHTGNLTYTLDHSRYQPRDTLANRFAGRNVSEFPGRLSNAVLGLSHEWRPGDGRFVNVLGGRAYAFRSEGTPSNIFDPVAERPPPIQNRSTSFGASNAVRVFVSSEVLAKGSVELARRLPTTPELFGDGLLIQAAPALRPEESLNLNLGFQFERGRPGSRYMQFETNVFRMALRDMIRLAPAGFAGVAAHSNLGRARITGFDVELKGDVAPWLYASAGLTYQNARDVLTHVPGTTVPNPTRGLRLPNMPWLFGSSLVELRRSDLFGPLQRSRLFHELAYTEEYFYAFEVSRHQDRRIPRAVAHTVGLEHQWLASGLTITAEVQNLTDAPVLNQFNQPLPGRTFRIRLRYTRLLDSVAPGITIQSGDGP